ncbi:MAG: patatin [Ilumatobacteraceae bacterium]|nr:patatin [Ilumatobacteraceae bacterium]
MSDASHDGLQGNARRALVLGGGGVAGIAWETGILVGLADAGLDLTAADLVVGTSAGSTVAAQVTSGEGFDALFARQLVPTDQSGEIAAQLDIEQIAAMFGDALRHASSPLELRAAIGHAALAADTVPESTRRAVIEHRLPAHRWPAGRALRIVAADAETGEVRVFSADDDVSIIDAVAASCAVPGVWPPVTIGHRRYVDGGVRSSTNADLAEGCGVIIVLAPVADIPGVSDRDVLAAIEQLDRTATVLTIRPDEASAQAIGSNPLDPETRAPAANAGRAQGTRIANEISSVWLPA